LPEGLPITDCFKSGLRVLGHRHHFFAERAHFNFRGKNMNRKRPAYGIRMNIGQRESGKHRKLRFQNFRKSFWAKHARERNGKQHAIGKDIFVAIDFPCLYFPCQFQSGSGPALVCRWQIWRDGYPNSSNAGCR